MESIADTTRTNSLQDIESYLTDFNKEIAEQTQGFAYNPVDGTLVATGPLYSTDDGVVYQTAAVPVEFKQEGTQGDQRGKQLQQPVMGTIRVSGGGIEILTANGSDGSQDTSFALAATIPDDGYQEPSGMVAQIQVSGLHDANAPVDGHREDSGDDQMHPGLTASGSYQTVTIVPSEVNQRGEVSYMLIVSQPEDDKAADSSADMSVFDFKEEAMKAESVQSAEEGKRVKATTRSQSAGMPMQLMCNYCNYTSPKRFLLARHMRAHSEERPYNCATCGRTFKTPVALQNHVNTHKGIRPNKCKECDASFTTSGELIRHVRYRHTYEKPHKCSECDYASVELSKLKRHVRSHTGERPFQCPHCLYASPDSFKLKRHLRVHTGEKPYVCDICDMHFTQSNSLKSHKLIHSGNKPVFQCELCPTTCGRKTDLKNHVLKIHTSDRPLQCKKCGKSFPDRYTYKIHMRTHDGQKCFRCELCPYSALMQRHLESHILTHTGEKPFRCESCDQSFRQKQLLKRHNNLYHNPSYVPPVPRSKRHICKECGKVFAHQGNMLRHLAMHDPDNAEYQHAIQNGDASMGEEEEEDEDEEDGGNHQVDGYSASYEDQYLTHQQPIQVQLVPVQSEEGQQVYIQIDSSQMGLLRQMEAAAAGEDQDDAGSGDAAVHAQSEPELTPMTPVRRGRGRPRKTVVQPPEDSDEDYTPASTPRRGRGRPPKTNKFARPGTRGRRRVIVEEEEEEEEEEEAAEGEEDIRESGDIQEALEEGNNAKENTSRKRPAEESSRENPSKRLKRESSSPTLEFEVSS